MKLKFGYRMIDITKIMAIKKVENDVFMESGRRTRYYVVLYMKGGNIYDEGFYTKDHRDELYDKFYKVWKRYQETFKE